MAYHLKLVRLGNFDATNFGDPNRSVHVFFARDMSVSRHKGTAMIGKSGRIEASRKLGAGVRASSPNMKNAEVERSVGVFSSANDAVVPIPEAEGRFWEVPEDMDMSGCDQCLM
jgi:hypothetical protein